MTAAEPTAPTAAAEPFSPWPLEWTDAHIRRFWDWYGSNPAFADRFFSRLVGHSILAAVRPLVAPRRPWGTVVDLGAGRGDLTALLLADGARVWAVDPAPAEAAAIAARFAGQRGLLGALTSPADLPAASADVVFLLETLEHLTPDVAAGVLRAAHRVLRPGGHLVATTPHAEDLAASTILCPHCACLFHTTQHLRPLTPPVVAAEAEAQGFRTVVATATYFTPHRGLHRALERVRRLVEWRQVARTPKPHLLYIGQRPVAGQ